MLVGVKLDGSPSAFEDHISGVDWSQRRLIGDKETVTGRPFSFPLRIGDSWSADYVDRKPYGQQTFAHIRETHRVVGWEDVTVPAGTFHTLKIESNGSIEGTFSAPASAQGAVVSSPAGAATDTRTERARTGIVRVITYAAFYYAPEVKYYVKSVQEQYNSDNVRTTRDTDLLVSFKPGH